MLRNEKGNALVLTVVILAVVMMFAMTMMFVGESSFKHADKEQKKTQAYYVAKTGAESVIKHLEDKGNAGDMRDELEELIEKTDLKEFGKGKYKEGDFEIEVKKETRNGKRVYLVKSTGEIEHGNNEGKDQITAVLTPEYEVEKSWGSGTVDAAGRIVFAHPSQLGGTGLVLSTDRKKERKQESPIFFKNINDLFIAEPAKKDIVDGFELIDRDMNDTHVFSEVLVNKSKPEIEPIQLIYGEVRENPSLTFPSKKGTDVIKNSTIIDVNNPNVGKLITEKYEVIDFNKKGNAEKTVREKEYLKIEAPVFELSGNNTIKTSRNRDIVVYTDVLNIMGNSKINVTGKGNVYFFVTGQANVYGKAEVGVDIDDLSSINANTNIHFYLKPGIQMTGEDDAQLKNSFVYGPEARLELDGGSIYRGMMLTEQVSFNGETTIQSPVDGTPNEDHDPIIGFEKIEWER